MSTPSNIGNSLSVLGLPDRVINYPTVVKRSAAYSSWPRNSWNNVILDTIVYDPSGSFDLISSQYIASGGLYYVIGILRQNATYNRICSIFGNTGTTWRITGRGQSASGSYNSTTWAQGLMWFAPGERVTLQGYTSEEATNNESSLTVIPMSYMHGIQTPGNQHMPYIKMALQANQNISGNTWTKVSIIESPQRNSAYTDNTLYRMTLPKGWYLTNVYGGSTTSGDMIIWWVRKNANSDPTANYWDIRPNEGAAYMDMATLIYSNGSDYFELWYLSWNNTTVGAGTFLEITPLPWLQGSI